MLQLLLPSLSPTLVPIAADMPPASSASAPFTAGLAFLILYYCSLPTVFPFSPSAVAVASAALSCAVALQRQQSYGDLKKLFEEASRVDPNWDKVFFQYAR